MGLLVDGEWHDKWYDTSKTGGKFVRSDSVFRNWVTADGSAGPTGDAGFKAEAGRYHLYVSLACPWAHRTLIFRAIKDLDKMIDVSVVHWRMKENGWTFDDNDPDVIADPIHKARFLHQVYTAVKPDYSGRVTVPVLYDKKTDQIVSNESADINQDLRPNRHLMKRRSQTCSTAWTGWKSACQNSGIWSGIRSQRRTGVCLQPWFGLIRSMSGISNATCAGSSITPICGPIPGNCINSPACRRP